MYLQNKLSPKLAAPLVKRCFPAYRGRRFFYEPATEVTLSGTYWDGGSRSSYVGLNLGTGQVGHVTFNTDPPQFGGVAQPVKVPLSPELAVVQYQVSGTYTYVIIWVHPDALPKLLTQ